MDNLEKESAALLEKSKAGPIWFIAPDWETNPNYDLETFYKDRASAVMPIKVKTSGVRVIDPAVNALLKPVFNKALRNTLNRECPDITFLPVKEGIVATTENSDFTFSVEVRGAFKSLDFDPFLENRIYEKEKEHKRKLLERKEIEKENKRRLLAEKRAEKLRQLQSNK